MARFEIVTVIGAEPGRVFDASLEVEVHTASMAGSGERAVGGVTAGRLGAGESVTWVARHFGVRWRMTSVVSVYERPGHFVDEQVRGPFKRWWHAHYFEPDGRGGTVMRDVVEFSAPLGVLGKAAELAVLRRYMPQLIRERNRYLKAVLEAAV